MRRDEEPVWLLPFLLIGVVTYAKVVQANQRLANWIALGCLVVLVRTMMRDRAAAGLVDLLIVGAVAWLLVAGHL